MLTNADITIYNRKYCPATRSAVWYHTVLKGVHFYCGQKMQLLANGLANVDVYKIRVPASVGVEKQYIPQAQYQEEKDISDFWTIQKGDFLIRGIGSEVKSLEELQKAGLETCKITGWSDNRRGGLPHWRIEGV